MRYTCIHVYLSQGTHIYTYTYIHAKKRPFHRGRAAPPHTKMPANPSEPALDFTRETLAALLRDFDARMLHHDDGSLSGTHVNTLVQTLVAHLDAQYLRIEDLEQRVDELTLDVGALKSLSAPSP